MISYNTLAKAVLTNQSMSNKKLQKICYYIEAWYLAINEMSLSNTEFEAWVHGPVCHEIYNEYKKYGWDDIPKYKGFLIINDKAMNFISKIMDYYGQFSADELENMTHHEEPWINARKNLKYYQSSNMKISTNDMMNYYKKQRELYTLFNKNKLYNFV